MTHGLDHNVIAIPPIPFMSAIPMEEKYVMKIIMVKIVTNTANLQRITTVRLTGAKFVMRIIMA